MGDMMQVGHTPESVGYQKRTPADRDQWCIAGAGFNPVDGFFQEPFTFSQYCRLCVGVDAVQKFCITEVEQAAGDGDVCCRQLTAAKNKPVMYQLVADRQRADLQWIKADMTAAAQSE